MGASAGRKLKEKHMLWKLAVASSVLWLVAMFSSYMLGGAIHILLAFAAVLALLSFVRRRRLS